MKALLFRALLAAGIALLLTNVALVFLIESRAPARELACPAARDATARRAPPEVPQRRQGLAVDGEWSGAVRSLQLQLPIRSTRARIAHNILL